jgi:hypothetical protein
MKTTDFSATITSSKLKENMNKMFGLNVNLNKYDREQLEDMRNKLRTRVFQQEGRAGINDLLTNETYQKDKAMLDLLNTRIKEMLGEDIKKLRDKMVELSEGKKGVKAPKYTKKAAGAKPDFLDMDKDGNKKEPMKKAVADKKEGPKKGVNPFAKVKEGAKPDFLDMDKDGNKKEPMKKAVADKKVKEGFPTVADAKARAEKEKTTGKFSSKPNPQNPSGTIYTKKHTKADAEPEKKSKATSEGKDEGKPGKMFKKIAKDAGERYGSKAAGLRVAGKIRADKAKAGTLEESNFKHNVLFVNESLQFLLQEDEEGKAKAITAAGDMVNDFTSWMQRVGQYQTKTMIELADAIKADFGAAESEAFKQAVGPALSATLETLTQQREAVSGAVAVLAGEATPDAAMGMEPGMDAGMPPAEPGMDMAAPDEMNPPAGDEFGASDAAAGMGTTGREMRESRFARKLAESHSIMSKLAK